VYAVWKTDRPFNPQHHDWEADSSAESPSPQTVAESPKAERAAGAVATATGAIESDRRRLPKRWAYLCRRTIRSHQRPIPRHPGQTVSPVGHYPKSELLEVQAVTN
jgi:hypothetical protein